jgi:hypothetical protein
LKKKNRENEHADLLHAKFGVKFHQKSEIGVANTLTKAVFLIKKYSLK